MNVYIKVLIGVILLAISFAAGWRVEYWHYTAERESAFTKALNQQNKNMDTLIEAHNKEVNHINDLNTQTTADQVKTQLLIQAQSDEIHKVEQRLSTIKVGSCTLNGNADSLLDSAYRAAFPASAPPVGKPKGR